MSHRNLAALMPEKEEAGRRNPGPAMNEVRPAGAAEGGNRS